jgi:hypothetical protein
VRGERKGSEACLYLARVRRTGRQAFRVKWIGDAAMQVLGGKMGEASAPQPQRTASLV